MLLLFFQMFWFFILSNRAIRFARFGSLADPDSNRAHRDIWGSYCCFSTYAKQIGCTQLAIPFVYMRREIQNSEQTAQPQPTGGRTMTWARNDAHDWWKQNQHLHQAHAKDLKSFAAIPSVSPSATWAHESQRFLVTRIATWNCPRFGTFKTNSLLPTRRNGGRKMGLCFAMFVFLTFHGPLASHDSNPYPKRSRIARYNATKIWMRNPDTAKRTQHADPRI